MCVSPWHESEAGVPHVAPAAVGGEAVVELVGGGGAVGGVAVVAGRQVHVLPNLLAVLTRPGGGGMVVDSDREMGTYFWNSTQMAYPVSS